MQIIARFLRATRVRPSPEIIIAATWLAALAGVEIAGRHSGSDLTDALLLLFLAFCAAATALVHGFRKLKLVQAGMRFALRLGKTLARLHVEFGFDFRGAPAVRPGFPTSWKRGLVILAVLTVGLTIFSGWFPSGLRALLAPRFYLLYLALLGVLWVSALAATWLLGFVIWAGIHDRFVESFSGRGVRPTGPERLARLAIMAVLVAAATILPSWAPLAIIAGSLIVVTIALAQTGSGLSILWRARKSDGLRAFDGRLLLWLQWAAPLTVAGDLVLLSRGQVLWTNDPFSALGDNPLTLLLGSALAWTAAAVSGLAVWHSLRYARLSLLGKPLPSVPVAAELAGTVERDARRQEIQHRRNIIRGLEKVFKRAARQRRRGGTGVWLGLQHWFMLGLSPDDNGLSRTVRDSTIIDGIVGPPFHQVVATRARVHYRQITTALEIDLILVEHGVPFRRLVRVLRMMFEIYDVYAGRQRAEERHFTGLPGVRVIIHDFDMAQSPALGRDNYPEPDYDQIGRARILHVFRDRGESEVREEVPSSWEGAPVLSGV